MFTIALLLFVLILTCFIFWLMKWKYSFWKRNKVPGPEPIPLVGNIGPTFTFSRHWGEVTTDWYNEYSNEPYVGYYKMLQPAVLARDPDLIKDVLITEFSKFRDNDSNLSKCQDPLTATNPFFVKSDGWKEARSRLSPVFSQNKMRSILPIMNGIGEHFCKYVRSFPPNTDFNAKELCIRFATESVVRSTFSIDPDCFNKEKKSEFVGAAEAIFAPSFLAGLKSIAAAVLPHWTLDYSPVSFIPHSVERMFRELVAHNKEFRTKGCRSNDIFEMFLQLQEKHNFDDVFLAGSSVTLFFDGSETSSSILSYVLHALAANLNCQEKLQQEICRMRSKTNGTITYDLLQEMDYLEGVILESLRLHPAVMVLQKVCTQEYTLPKISGQSKPVTIKPGTVVTIPVLGIHSDAKYYPEPEKFEPERFSEEEQRNRHYATFLGFGEGPRICPGMRFALLQTKLILVCIVENFHLKLSPNHKPIVKDPQSFLPLPKDGILIRLEAR